MRLSTWSYFFHFLLPGKALPGSFWPSYWQHREDSDLKLNLYSTKESKYQELREGVQQEPTEEEELILKRKNHLGH